MTVKKWIFQILIGIDQLTNAIAGGYADETLSSRAHRMRQKGQTYWRWTADFIDMNHATAGAAPITVTPPWNNGIYPSVSASTLQGGNQVCKVMPKFEWV